MRTLVLGDVHGAHRALVQVFERCRFDPKSDRLIFIGDVADGWPDTRACIDALLAVPHLVHLLGNHDQWFAEWLSGRDPGEVWRQQGGRATLVSYGLHPVPTMYGGETMVSAHDGEVPTAHRMYLANAKLWHEEGGRMFVHGGWPWHETPHPSACSADVLMWDRELWRGALDNHGNRERLTQFREVYVGHTTTTRAGFTEPVQRCEVWNLDQGAGWEGKLSIMDVDTKQFWQSDVVSSLYPEATGRRRSA